MAKAFESAVTALLGMSEKERLSAVRRLVGSLTDEFRGSDLAVPDDHGNVLFTVHLLGPEVDPVKDVVCSDEDAKAVAREKSLTFAEVMAAVPQA